MHHLEGQRFGRLTVIHRYGSKRSMVTWLCKCECGNEKIVTSAQLLNGVTRSCGCLRRELVTQKNTKHGYSKTPTYRAWKSIRDRCLNPRCKDYADYGNRGIGICERWQGEHGFENFLADMGERPDGMSIDRINVNGNYEPSNCRWANDFQQANNRRNNKYITINGVTKTLSEWGRYFNINIGNVYSRLKKGMSYAEAIVDIAKKKKYEVII